MIFLASPAQTQVLLAHRTQHSLRGLLSISIKRPVQELPGSSCERVRGHRSSGHENHTSLPPTRYEYSLLGQSQARRGLITWNGEPYTVFPTLRGARD